MKMGHAEQEALDKQEEAKATPPILGFADYSLPFELHNDASQIEFIGSCFVSGAGQCEMGNQLCQQKSHKICAHLPRIQISVLAL